MPELDDRLEGLRSALQERVVDDFPDVMARRRRIVRRQVVGALAGCAVVAAASVSIAVLPSAGSDTVRIGPGRTPTPTPTPSATSHAPVDRTSSQSAGDARRDGVLPAVAHLSFSERVGVVTRVKSKEGVWVISRMPGDTGPRSGVLGHPQGPYGKRWVGVYEYGEVLLLDSTERHILRAYPLPGLPPRQLLVTPEAVYCLRQGDGALPDSVVCRIDRDTGDWIARVFPSDLDSGFGPESGRYVPPNWTVAHAVDAGWFEGMAVRNGKLLLAGWGGVAQADPNSLAVGQWTPECAASTLTVEPGQRVSPATGEHGVTLVFTNVGTEPCGLFGYPGVTLFASDGERLRFRYAQGDGQYVTPDAAGPVLLAPQDRGYLLLAKYRCDQGGEAAAARGSIRLVMGGTLRVDLPQDGVENLSLCVGGRRDPGNVVAVSPFVGDYRALFP